MRLEVRGGSLENGESHKSIGHSPHLPVQNVIGDIWFQSFHKVLAHQLAGQLEQERIVAACGNEREPERATIELRQRQ
jgi:hypothetical protein